MAHRWAGIRGQLHLPGAVCQAVFKQENGIVKLFHVIETYDAGGALYGHIEERRANIVGPLGKHYQGTFDQKFYDLNGTSSSMTRAQ